MTREEFKQLAKLVNTLKKQVKEIDANGDAYPENDRALIFEMLETSTELHNLLNTLY